MRYLFLLLLLFCSIHLLHVLLLFRHLPLSSLLLPCSCLFPLLLPLPSPSPSPALVSLSQHTVFLPVVVHILFIKGGVLGVEDAQLTSRGCLLNLRYQSAFSFMDVALPVCRRSCTMSSKTTTTRTPSTAFPTSQASLSESQWPCQPR